jgi:tartrate-resistant acid phosphatase type 5
MNGHVSRRSLSALVLSIMLAAGAITAQQASPKPPAAKPVAASPAALAARLPAAARAKATTLLKSKDVPERVRLARELARDEPAARAFLLAQLPADRDVLVRRVIVDVLGRVDDPRVRTMLEQRVTEEPDVLVAMLALERLRLQRVASMRVLLSKRLELSRKTEDREMLERLASEDERWISLERGTMLPAFMREPPRLFSLAAADRTVRVLAFGDYGTGAEQQKSVAAAMRTYHGRQPFDFGITLGDNFYSVGMLSPSDERWKTWWDALYDPMGIKVYATLGNHDWGHPDSPASEILYSQQSPSWRMPAPYYTFTAGAAQFFALDTNEVSEAQVRWLKDALERSTARWKIVYGHHVMYSAGRHDDNPRLTAQLMPILRGRADIYICGHEHDLQHLGPDEGVHFFVSGGAGAGLRPMGTDPRLIWGLSAAGFTVLDIAPDALNVKFIGTAQQVLYEYRLQPRAPTQ